MNTINEFSKYNLTFQTHTKHLNSSEDQERHATQKIINPPFMIDSLLSLAFLSLSENRPLEAKAYYFKALSIARSSGVTNLEVKPLLGLSELAFEDNDDQQARDYYRQALFIAENSRSFTVRAEFNLHQLSPN